MSWASRTLGLTTGLDWSLALEGLRTDPYLVWFDVIGFAGFGLKDKEKLVVQIELEQPYADQLDRVRGLEVPGVYREPLGTSGRCSCFVSGRIDRGSIAALMGTPGVQRVQLEMSNVPVSDPASGYARTAREAGTASAGRTWLGIIDEGCPFLHRNFAGEAGRSRVEYLWDQNPVEPQAPLPRPWRAPAGLGYGREMRPAVDAAAFREPHGYEQLDYADLLTARATHGCGVMDLAAGAPAPLPPQRLDGRVPPVARDAAAGLPIVFVQLPRIDLRDTCCSSLGVHALDALRYMVHRVEHHGLGEGRRDPSARLVVNMSYGSLAGAHDGSSILERAMDELIETRGNLAIVLAAGNTFAPDRPTHALLGIEPGQSGALRWRIQPDDGTDSYLELWFDETALDHVTVSVTPPGGAVQKVRVGQSFAWHVGDTPVAGAVFPRQSTVGLNGSMLLLALAPSAPRDDRPGAPSGLWTIDVVNSGSAAIQVHAWIERDDLVAGQFRRRQQSWLELGDDPQHVNQRYSLSSVANGRHTIVVGGYRLSDGEVAAYSASGPTRGGARHGPDVSAPSERGASTVGLRVAGTTTGVTNDFAGTSAAAPTVARWLATWYASRPPGDVGIATVRARLARLARRAKAMDENEALRESPVRIDVDLNPPL